MRILVLSLALFFTACYVNERGISSRYYNDCREYYDAAGVYHKVCDENIIDFSDGKKAWNFVSGEDKKSAIASEQQAKEVQLSAEEKELDKVEAELEKEEEAKKQAAKEAAKSELK